MAIKLKDIARDLGVSPVTISKALRNHPDISKTTRERVEQRVKELGYRPNLTARSLVTGRSSLIGLIVPDLIHPFFAEVAKGLSTAVRERGYFLVMSSSDEDPALEQEEIEQMLAHRLDALVIASCQMDADSLAEVKLGDTPLVLVDRFFDSFHTHFVGSDDYAAGKLATEHLLSVGCKRIAHIRGPETNVGSRRCKAFVDTLKKHGISCPPEFIVSARTVDAEGQERGAEAFRQLADLKRPPDGVFCYNDVVAIGSIGEALKMGLRVPEDVAVIGCGNLHIDELIRVPLSSVDQRSREIGTRTAKLILEILSLDIKSEPHRVVLQPRLAPRASTMRLKVKRPKPQMPLPV